MERDFRGHVIQLPIQSRANFKGKSKSGAKSGPSRSCLTVDGYTKIPKFPRVMLFSFDSIMKKKKKIFLYSKQNFPYRKLSVAFYPATRHYLKRSLSCLQLLTIHLNKKNIIFSIYGKIILGISYFTSTSSTTKTVFKWVIVKEPFLYVFALKRQDVWN